MGTYTSAAPSPAPSIPFGYWMECFRKYATFSGRSRRAEYWSFTLANIIIMIPLYMLAFGSAIMSGGTEAGGPLGMVGMAIYVLYAISTLIPGIAVTVRRLHDTGRSGWWLLIGLIPLINLVLLVFMFLNSQPGSNEYGPNPKGQ
jgi:uncharacterized membrane protein YhaH (DUF805 family)